MLRPTLPITTERLLLRAFTEDDLDALHAMHGRADVARYVPWPARSREEVREVLARKRNGAGFANEGDALSLAVILRDTGDLIGDIVLVWVSEIHQAGEIGFLFHPDHHGRGYGTEASIPLLRLGFEQLHLHRIFGRADARNGASIRLMEKLGLRREAHLRQNEFIKGEWTDEVICAMLAEEWKPA